MSDLELGPLRVGIIGAGNVGCVFGRALTIAGMDVVQASANSAAGRERAAHVLGIPVAADSTDVAAAAELVLITTPDDVIADIVDHLDRTLDDDHVASLRLVHTSGRVPVTVLDPLRERGATVAAVHPLETITASTTPAQIAGAAAAITAADDASRVFAHALAHALLLHPFDLADEDRVLYHAASSFAANFTVTLQGAVEDLARAAHISEGVATAAFTRLARHALDRCESQGAAAALTGPIVRGDVGTVMAHIEALDALHSRHATTYRNMAVATAHLAVSSGRLDVDAAARIGDAVALHRPAAPNAEGTDHAND